MALPDNPPPDDLTLKSKKGEEPIYMHLPSFKFCTLMHDGETEGRSGGRTGRVEYHDTHVCKPETKTKLGFIGHDRFERYEMAFFAHFKQLDNHQLRMWRVENQPDIIIGDLRKCEPVPGELPLKLLRNRVPLLESQFRPYAPENDVFSEILN